MSVLALVLCTGFSSAEIADFVHPYVNGKDEVADSEKTNKHVFLDAVDADQWSVWDALTPSHALKSKAISGAPPFAQKTECADTTVLFQKPGPRAFAHQEWQPLSLASQHIERTDSSFNFTVSGSNLRLAIFMTTALSEDHRSFFNCWENAIQNFKFLRDADLVLHAPRPLLPDDLAKFQHMRHITVRLSDTTGGKSAGAIKSFTEAFGSKGFHQGWFKNYDWVIRLNPDVLFMDAPWILHAMQKASIDGIFQICLPGCRINSDFFAVRPKAVDFARVDKSIRRNAEANTAWVFKNILAAGRYTWLEGGLQHGGACRISGRKSPVVHNHSLKNFCPDYLGQRRHQAEQAYDDWHKDMKRCHFV